MLALRNILGAFEDPKDGIFGRLDLIARINLDLYPSMVSKHLPLTNEGVMYNAYTELQTLIKGNIGQRSLTDALHRAIEIIDQGVAGLSQEHQIAIQLDDYRFLLQFIPVYESILKYGNREVRSIREHPNLDRALGFGGLKGVKSALEEKIATLIEFAKSKSITPVTATYLTGQFDDLLTSAMTKFNDPNDLQDLKALIQSQKETAERVFKTTIEPNAKKRITYYKAINEGIKEIQNYITHLDDYNRALRNRQEEFDKAKENLNTAKKASSHYLYFISKDPAVTAAETALQNAKTALEKYVKPKEPAYTLPSALRNFEYNI